MPPPLITTSQPFTARAAAPATLATRPTPPPPPVYGLGGGSGSGGDGYGFDTACPQEPGPVETVLPAQAPILIHGPGSMSDDGAPGGDLEMDYILEEEERGPPPIEVTLNIDIPKSSRPPAEGTPSTTVLNVNPSWHVVFVETVQRQRIRTSIRIQFCPSSTTARLVEHRAKIRRLQTVQVIAYASRRVELSRRIQGQSLLNKGGFILHLDPSSITFNEASYGFTLSLSSFEIEQLSRARHSRPDTPLPLARQQNSAYCRRNLKEMYYDTVSKDVTITLRPSGDIFYAHSVVLESHAYFRALVEQQQQLRSSVAGVVGGGIGDDGEDGDGGGGMVVETEAVVDEEGYAQPLRPQQQQRPSSSSSFQGSSRYLAGGDGFLGTGGGDGSQDRTRARIAIEMNDTSPTVFRAVLHYMYMGHVPVTGVFSTQEPPQQQPQQPVGPSAATAGQGSASGGAVQDGASISAHQGGSSSSGMSGMDALTEAATIAATESFGVGAPFSSTAGLPASALPISADSPMGPPPPPSSPIEATTTAPATAASANVNATSTTHLPPAPVAAPMPSPAPAPAQATTIVGEFPWRDVYEIASRYQLSGLMHLSKVALLSRLDVERAVRELFEWSYHHWSLVPAYVSFLIERVDATVLSGPSLLWPYHDVCPVYDEIMLIFLQKLNERKETSTLI
ncbi:hypothetical protein BGX23_003151 [Mortierella sp. AD031]|nr:hypothetical protein BGX23_003151 [Mortierella sp. AD031]